MTDTDRRPFDLQAAINEAKPGDTILVPPGSYCEAVTLPANRWVTITEHTPPKTDADLQAAIDAANAEAERQSRLMPNHFRAPKPWSDVINVEIRGSHIDAPLYTSDDVDALREMLYQAAEWISERYSGDNKREMTGLLGRATDAVERLAALLPPTSSDS